MREFFQLLAELWGVVVGCWDYVQPERQAVSNWVAQQTPVMRRRLQTIKQRVVRIARLAIIWPFVLVGVAMFTSPKTAQTLVPILALLPLVLLGILFTTWTALATFGVIAIVPTTAPLGIGRLLAFTRSVIKTLAVVLLIDLSIGVYLSVVPVSKDAGLVPLLVLVVACLVIASIVVGAGWLRKIFIFAILAITVIFFLGGRDAAAKKLKELDVRGGLTTPFLAKNNVCPDAFNREASHISDYRGQNPPYFDIVLREDCFGESIYPPNEWTRWAKEFVSNEEGRNVAFWFYGSKPTQPYGPNEIPNFENRAKQWRLRGKGTIRYYRTGGPITVAPPPPDISRRAAAVTEPTATAIGKAECTAEANAAQFSGIAVVSLLVAEDGNVRDIKLVKSTGIPSLDQKMIEAAGKYKFLPASQGGKAVPFEISNLEIQLARSCQ